MKCYTRVFRVRITEDELLAIDQALSKWREVVRWERPGVFYRLILKLGLEAHKKQA